jgi:hypothetical protein
MFVRSASVSTATVMNLPMCNLALMNPGSLARDSSTSEYHCGGFSVQGTEESPPREGLPTDPIQKDHVLGGEVLADSTIFGLGGAPAEFVLGAALAEGDRAPLAPGEL